MSWLWTRMSVSVSRGVSPGLCRRDPMPFLIPATICSVDNACACKTPASWMKVFNGMLRRIRG